MNTPFKNSVKLELREPGHQYVDGFSRIWTSQSAFMKCFQIPFDVEGKSMMCAKAKIKREGGSFADDNIRHVQAQFKAEWSGKGKVSTDHGTAVHYACEMYLRTGVKDVNYPDVMYQWIYDNYIKPYYRNFPEQIFYLEDMMVAGTADLPCIRKNSSDPVLDIFDFKTNIEKGIQFQSKYKQYFKYPIDFLEDCNYNQYALQLSLYAYMAEMTYGMKIGRLAIVFIDSEFNMKEIAVPYLRPHVELMIPYYMEHHMPKVQMYVGGLKKQTFESEKVIVTTVVNTFMDDDVLDIDALFKEEENENIFDLVENNEEEVLKLPFD